MPSRSVVESNNQFISFGRLLVSDRPGSEVFERDGMSTYWAGSPAIFFNLLFLSEQVSGPSVLNRRLRAAADYMRAKTQPGLLLVCDDYLDNEARAHFEMALEDAGLVAVMETVGMAGDLLAFSENVKRPDVRFERVTDEASLRECADINSDANSFPSELMREGLSGATWWNERVFCYIAYQDGEAVSTSSVIESDGILYVALVATRPEAQRRGLAEATMRHALKAAHEATGIRHSCLHATQAGQPVYERMGYKQVTRIVGYGTSGVTGH
jgi:GNAT superfamily N-acetyltransferase